MADKKGKLIVLDGKTIERAVNDVARAHDRASQAAEDPEGSNDHEHECLVALLDELHALYTVLKSAGVNVKAPAQEE